MYKRQGLSFVDVDLVIQRREGALLQEILDTQGAEAFLDAEEEAVLSLQCQNAVIAPGGSAVCREKGALYLKELGRVIYLRVPLEELDRRIQDLATRGIAMAPGQGLADLMAYRGPLYEKYADLIVDCPVSYTHLGLPDSSTGSGGHYGRRRPEFHDQRRADCGPVPVSYTHLDVYKRQDQGRFLPPDLYRKGG